MTETADGSAGMSRLPGASAGSEAIRSEIRGEQLRLLFRSDLPIAVNVVNGLMAVAVLWPVAPPEILLAWISAMTLLCLARIALRHAYLRREEASARDLPWAALHAIGSGFTGLLWSATALTVLYVDGTAYHMFVGLMAAGMSAGALSTSFPYIPSFLAYVVPYVGPMALAFLVHGGAAYSCLGALMAAFIGLLGVIVRNFNATFLESVRLRAMLGQSNAELEARVAERTAALRDSESRLRAIFDNAPECVYLVAPDGTVLEVNASGVAMIEADAASEVIGKTVFEFIDPEDNPAVRGIIERVFRGESAHIELTVTTLRGQRRWWEAISVPLSGPDGRVSVLLGIARDVTDSRALEAQLRQSQKMEAIGQLTGGIAHDFNNLLNIIIGSLDLLLTETQLEGRHQAIVGEALTAAERGAKLIRYLLAFARKQMLRPAPLDANRLILNMVPLLRRTLGQAIEVVTELEFELWPCVADATQIETAILNLSINARDAMPSGGRLTIATGNVEIGADEAVRDADNKPGAYVRISVADSGEGMNPETLARAFEPFFTTKEVGRGSGLGLSMVYGFAKQSGGHVSISSEPGRGTVVTLLLPRGEEPGAERYKRRKADTAAVLPRSEGR